MQNLAAEKLGEYEIDKLQSCIKEFAPQVAQLLKEEPDRGGINIRYAALELREKLIQYAAETKDHTVSNNFIQLLRRK